MMIVVVVMEAETKERYYPEAIAGVAVAIAGMAVTRVIAIVAGPTVTVPALVTAEPAKAFAAMPAVNLLNQAVIHQCGRGAVGGEATCQWTGRARTSQNRKTAQ